LRLGFNISDGLEGLFRAGSGCLFLGWIMLAGWLSSLPSLACCPCLPAGWLAWWLAVAVTLHPLLACWLACLLPSLPQYLLG